MFRAILLVLLLSFGLPRIARAETTQCTNITSLPAVISTQGIDCLKQDLATAITSGAAITINTNNVTLDCNDWKIGGLAAGASTNALGISAYDRSNVTIRHCGGRGFYTGINLFGGAGHLIEDNRADLNTYVGIQVYGDAFVLRRNRVVDTGGRPASSASFGIKIPSGSSGGQVLDNQVANVTVTGTPDGQAFGLRFNGVGHEIASNLFTSILPAGAGSAYGTYGASGAIASLRDNTAINAASTTGQALMVAPTPPSAAATRRMRSTSACSTARVPAGTPATELAAHSTA